MDKIIITGLEASAIIGTLPEERTRRQTVRANITLYCRMKRAGKTDTLSDAVDYSKAERDITAIIENSSFKLLETLAQTIAAACLEMPHVEKVKIALSKPDAPKKSRSIEVVIKRSKTPGAAVYE